MPNFVVMRTSLAAALLIFSTLAVQAQGTNASDSAANAGRRQVTAYLDQIAAEQTAARRSAVAAITTRSQAEARQAMVRKKILALIGGLPEMGFGSRR
jgi:hypothetical protein